MTSRLRGRAAVAGAGVYGSTIALHLAARGYAVELFDPLGLLAAASAINQYRVHAGYHYPRSADTIEEVLAARGEFLSTFAPAIVRGTANYYAIPHEGSLTPPDVYEKVMRRHGLALRPARPDWMDFGFIDRCYEVEEGNYDPDLLRSLIEQRLRDAGVQLHRRAYTAELRDGFDAVVHATYGLGPSLGHFDIAKYQVAEKILTRLPGELARVALVVVDGPFTAFDPYGSSGLSLFGSARHTNHWTTNDPATPVPAHYAELLNAANFAPCPFTHFEQMREDAIQAVPAAAQATYEGSRFTMRVVEDNPAQDRRILYVRDGAPGELHVFAGKVVSAVTAARTVADRVDALG